jgi:CRP/FNR family transcriptional regulator, cyclic AMP receptor protein
MMENLERSLREHPFAKGLPDHMLAFLNGCTQNMRFQTDEYLFREGQAEDYLYLLRKGVVELQSHMPGKGALTLESLGPGESIGASILFPPYDWPLDARAVSPVLVFAVDGECLRKKIADDPVFGCAVLKKLLVDVHGRLTRARIQQLDLYRGELREETR